MSKETCQYDMFYNPQAAPTGEKYMHARPVNNGKVTMNELIRELSKRLHQSEGILRGTISEFMREATEQLEQGKHVFIEGLGGFQITLSCPPGIQKPDDVRAGRIGVKSIEFTPDQEMIKGMRQRIQFQRTQWKNNANDNMDFLVSLVREHFSKPENAGVGISSRFLVTGAQLTRKRAGERLREMVMLGLLENPSPDPHHPFYLPGEKLFPQE